jgi:hypothetical protein
MAVFEPVLVEFWVNCQMSRGSVTAFQVNGEEIILDVNNFSFFGICGDMVSLSNNNSIRQCFRAFHAVGMKAKYLT